MIPVLALVGRPNVGKSTLFNRLTRSRDALVADFSGLTRDRQYGEAKHNDRPFIVIDTGGIDGSEEGIDAPMADQALLAIEEADLSVILVDGRSGLNPGDQHIVEFMRKQQRPFIVAVNKIDGIDQDVAMGDFYQLGVSDIHAIAATQGRGVNVMLDKLLAEFPEAENSEQDDEESGIKIAVAGRPNVGKSTLVNRLLGEERVVVYDQPGTTRDSVYIPYERRGQKYTLIDTAGIRRRGKTKEVIEKFSVVKSLQAIQDANVVVLLVDARDSIVEQDLHLLGYVLETGRALVIALNKWDGMNEYDKDSVKKDIRRRFVFVDFAKIHFISALHGTGVGNLYKSIDAAYASASKKLLTPKLNELLQRAVSEHAPPMHNNRRIKLRYAHAGGRNPPLIVIHGKQTGKLPASYVKYLEKTFRKLLKLEGTPIRIELRSDENPYTKGEVDLTDQQIARKRRVKKNREFLKAKS